MPIVLRTRLFLVLLCAGLCAGAPPARADFTQQGSKLVGTGAAGSFRPQQGYSVAISADGSTAIVGGPLDRTAQGSAWVYVRSGGAWTQQGSRIASGGVQSVQGTSVALSGDGNTAVVGGPGDVNGRGAIYVFARSGGTWSVIQNRLQIVGPSSQNLPRFGSSVGLSTDGNTLIVGGENDDDGIGAAWIFTRSGGGQFSLATNKLVGSGAIGDSRQGTSVAISGDGNTAIVGGYTDNGNTGAVWIYALENGVWSQQVPRLVAANSGGAGQGVSVALSSDGNTAAVGGSSSGGGVWVYTRSNGAWTQQGDKLVGTFAVGDAGDSSFVSLSADGNTLLVGGPGADSGNGAAWVFTRANGVWTQQGDKLIGTGATGAANQGWSVALSADSYTAIAGGLADDSYFGAAWVFENRMSGPLTVTPSTALTASGPAGGPFLLNFNEYTLSNTGLVALDYSVTPPSWLDASPPSGSIAPGATATVTVSANANANGMANGNFPGSISFTNTTNGAGNTTRDATLTVAAGALQVSPAGNMASSGTQSGPFVPSSFSYNVSATSGTADYTITGVPSWLTASSTSGTVTSAPTQITFTVNANALNLPIGTYGPATITFTNTSNGVGNTTRTATLTVAAGALQVSPAANMSSSGTQFGPFVPSSFSYNVSAASGTANYTITGMPSWLTASSTSGTVTSAPTPITFTVNASALDLPAGTYGPATITFTNISNGLGNTTRTATLTVAGALQVSPAGNMASSGTQFGPFVPSSFSYIVSATSGTANYTITGVPTWLTASSTSGTVTSALTPITFTVNTNALNLPVGTYGPATITFTNTSSGVGNTTRAATLTVSNAGTASLLSSILPTSRSVQVGSAATAFATVMNVGNMAGTECALSLGVSVPATFSYKTTDPNTNALTGTANTPVGIPAGGAQSFMFAITPNAPFDATVPIVAKCGNIAAAPIVPGLNTLLLTASATPVPDIVALAASIDPGYVNLPGATGTGAFAVATVNIGADAPITVSADPTPAFLPVQIKLCQTNASAACINPTVPAAQVNLTITANATPTFSIFVTGTGNVPNDPANNRVFVRFKDAGGVTRGSTSVAVKTQ